jgi:hypothetical protein
MPWVPAAMGASSQAVQSEACSSQARVKRVVRKRRREVEVVVGREEAVERVERREVEGRGVRVRAFGRKEGRMRKCRRARCVMV